MTRPDVELASVSDAGCLRTHNEDSFAYCEPDDEATFRDRGRLLVVADGIGGHRGGGVASRIAADVLCDTFCSFPSSHPRAVLIAGFERARQRIAERAGLDAALAGMGTTCSAAIVRHGQLSFGHIGDSRIYLIRDADAILLTRDHTVAEQLRREGEISAADARVHGMRHVLTAALGADIAVVADFAAKPWPLQAEDVLLVCSDGLHDVVEAREMARMTQRTSMHAASRALVDLAKTRGAPDNITLQLLRVCATPAGEQP